MNVGGGSKSSLRSRKVCRRSRFTPAPVTMLPRNKDNTEKQCGTLLCRMGLIAALTLLPAPGRAQSPARAQPPVAGKKTGGYTINVHVNLVDLQSTGIHNPGGPVN